MSDFMLWTNARKRPVCARKYSPFCHFPSHIGTEIFCFCSRLIVRLSCVMIGCCLIEHIFCSFNLNCQFSHLELKILEFCKRSIGIEAFQNIDDIFITIFDSCCNTAACIRSCIGLCQAKRAQCLSWKDFWKESFLLFFCRIRVPNTADIKRSCYRKSNTKGSIYLGNFFYCKRIFI